MVSKNRLGLERADRVQPTPQGGAYVDAVISRVGILEYRQPDGTVRRELRPAEEVLAPESVASYRDAPVTIDHPPANVTPDTWKATAVGHVSADVGATSVMQAADKPPLEALSARLVIQDSSALRQIQSGMLLELSPGYTVELDMTPGYDSRYGAYDAIQRKIRCNHIALLPPGMGRQGEGVSLRLDSEGNAVLESTKGDRMDEDAVKNLVVGMMPDMDELVAKVSEQVSSALPELVKGLVTEAMAGGGEPPAEAPAEVADEAPADGELPKEDEEAPADGELPKEDEEAPELDGDRMDAKVAARVATIKLYERATRQDADLAKSDRELLSHAVVECGGKVRKDASNAELRSWLDGRLSSPILKQDNARADTRSVDLNNPSDIVAFIDSVGDKE